MSTQSISPLYGLLLVRLADGAGDAHPGLVLHSPHLTWPFDPQARQLDDLVEVAGLAAAEGLRPVKDLFPPDLPAAARPWTFHLPAASRPARLSGPGGVLAIGQTPYVTREWWSLAVTDGGRCRMLVAACVCLQGAAVPATQAMREAAADGRVFGATINVEFFPASTD